MPDIPNKGRILRLLQYLYLNTDEEHAATTQNLIDALAETGFKANRKTVKDDIDVMNNMGYDIVINVSSGNSFFLGDRTFELPELKLLIDAVSSSRFISAEKSIRYENTPLEFTDGVNYFNTCMVYRLRLAYN